MFGLNVVRGLVDGINDYRRDHESRTRYESLSWVHGNDCGRSILVRLECGNPILTTNGPSFMSAHVEQALVRLP
ncbi:hypothetical protein JOF56_009988 [Kibdelosporangium banguiense]|uniref:Uncharacterized protein n=1 Tax=Kibdelosporangium banguiense TaxID=1365924 RepID=A0ABS4U038_9PSEU|nr:hypothetical protein [Kibdelosporangium banguiense]